MSGKGRKSFDFYNDIDEILGTRAASSPSILLESGANAEEVEERQDIQIPESWSNSHDHMYVQINCIPYSGYILSGKNSSFSSRMEPERKFK